MTGTEDEHEENNVPEELVGSRYSLTEAQRLVRKDQAGDLAKGVFTVHRFCERDNMQDWDGMDISNDDPEYAEWAEEAREFHANPE